MTFLVLRSSKKTHKTTDHSRAIKRRKVTIPVSFTKKQFCIFAKKRITKEAAEILVDRYVCLNIIRGHYEVLHNCYYY